MPYWQANTQIRGQRSEVIVRNLRPGRRHDGENRALADIRIADKTDVRNALEFQFKLGHFALLPRLGEIRRLAGRRGEMRVAPAAAAAVKQHMALTGLVHVGHQTAVRDQPHRRAHRHLDDKLFGALAAAQGRPRRFRRYPPYTCAYNGNPSACAYSDRPAARCRRRFRRRRRPGRRSAQTFRDGKRPRHCRRFRPWR